MFDKIGVCKSFAKIHWKTPVPESVLIILQARGLQLYGKETSIRVSCEFCKKFQSTYFVEYLLMTASYSPSIFLILF